MTDESSILEEIHSILQELDLDPDGFDAVTESVTEYSLGSTSFGALEVSLKNAELFPGWIPLIRVLADLRGSLRARIFWAGRSRSS